MLFCPEWSHGHSGSGAHTALFSSPGGTKLSANRRGSACLVPHRWRRVLQCLSCNSDSRSAGNHDSWMRFRQPNRKGDRSKAGMVDHGFSTLRIFTCTTSGFNLFFVPGFHANYFLLQRGKDLVPTLNKLADVAVVDPG